MKTILTTLALAVMIIFAGCVDLDDIYRRLDQQEKELATIKTLVDAINKKVSVVSYTELSDKSGYELTMSDGSKIVVKHGTQGAKGDKGDKGDNGKDGDANLTITETDFNVTITYKGVSYTLSKFLTTMTLTTTKSVGSKIQLNIHAAEADRPNVWIDLNNNAQKDNGEAVTSFESMVEYTIGSQTITVYGKVTHMFCNNNQLTSLDLSNNSKLELLNCGLNRLTSLDLSKNTKLISLNCSLNNLNTSLDLSSNTELEELYCSSNQLTSLDLSKNTKLAILNCSFNKLTSLNVTHNKELFSLFCYVNKISGSNMTTLVNSLPDRTGKDSGSFYVFFRNSDDENVITAAQAAVAKGKNWSVRDNNGNPYPPGS